MGAQGTATLDFGAFPGKSDASVTVTGQAGIVAGSLVEAWLRLEATTDHSADEHLVETLKVAAGNIVGGTGFTIYGVNTSENFEPLETIRQNDRAKPLAAQVKGNQLASVGGRGTRIYGKWTVAWVWN